MNKIWLKHYFEGVPEFVDVDQYHSLADLLKKSCQQFSGKGALTQLGVTLSYSDLEQQSRYFSAFLQYELKLKKGDRFGIMLPNTFQFVIAAFSALRLGVVVVPINPLETPRELIYQLNDAQVSTILVLDQFLDKVQSVVAQTKLEHLIVTNLEDLFPPARRFFMHWVLKIIDFKKYLKKLFKRDVITYSSSLPRKDGGSKRLQNIEFMKGLERGKILDYKDPSVDPEDLAFLQYTGGTTGTPKAAMLTHRNMVANVIQCITWVRPVLKEISEHVIIALPLYHIFSLTICFLSFFSIGGLGILVLDPRRITDLIRILEKEKQTILVGVNTLFNALMKHSKFETLDFSTLMLTVSGGMKLQKTVADRWQEITGKVILEGYGLTEASPVVCINPVNLKSFNGSVGFPISSTDISIRNNLNEELLVGEIGELWVKGPQVMKGYLNQTKDTIDTITADGWLKTGDMAYVNSDGFVFLVDRKKELIIVSGFNVYPSEVESVIGSMPEVFEVAVVGVPDEASGEAVKAYIVKKSQDLTREEVVSYCKLNLLPYKVPHQIEFIKVLPKSSVGKILKRRLI